MGEGGMRFARSLDFAGAMVRGGVVPSAAVAIGRGDEVLATAVVGQACTRTEPRSAGAGTLYDMASLTKPMATAMVALKLHERGTLSLEDGIGRWLDAPADKRGITLLHLLTHTSGLPAHILLERQAQRPADAMGVILGLPLDHPVGTDVVYSCLGYIVLGEILARAGGEPLDRLARRLVFGPLGMEETGFNPTAADVAATEWDEGEGFALTGVVHDENARFLGGVAGNAGLFSTVGDTARFASMLACRGRARGGEFLPRALFDLAAMSHTPGMAESRGIGLSIYDGRTLSCGERFPHGSIGHTGFTGTSFWVDVQSGLYAVLLTNAVHFGRNREEFFRARRQFHNTVMAEFRQGG